MCLCGGCPLLVLRRFMPLGQKQVEIENSRNCTVHGTVKRGEENAQVSRPYFPKCRKRNDRSRVASINRGLREIEIDTYTCAEAFERRRSSKMAELLLSGKRFPFWKTARWPRATSKR